MVGAYLFLTATVIESITVKMPGSTIDISSGFDIIRKSFDVEANSIDHDSDATDELVFPTLSSLVEPTRYTPEEIDYFVEIAFGSEFGGLKQRIIKWDKDIRIRVHGSPTAADQQELDKIVEELSELLDTNPASAIEIKVLDYRNLHQANVDLYFVPHQVFHRYDPNYQPDNYGFASTITKNDHIDQASILVTTTDVSQEERSHLLREELTQILGLMQDSYQYPDSIFYQGWTHTNAFSDLDRVLIQILYRQDILPGMDQLQVRKVLENFSATESH